MSEPLGCGSCTFCCRAMTVDDLEPVKPEGKWCPHIIKGTGCGIYETRPASCRQFECLWLQSQRTEHPLPLELRPDKSRVMLVPYKDEIVVAKISPGMRHKVNDEPMSSLLKRFLREGLKIFVSVDGQEMQMKERFK